MLAFTPPREAAADEVLGQVVVGGYEVSVCRRTGAVLAKAGSGSSSASPRRSVLPPSPLSDSPPLLDRDIELAAVQSLLQATPPPIVEISGRMGVGKTSLVRCLTNVLYIDAAGLGYRRLLQHLYERAFESDAVCAPSVDRLRVLFSSWKIPVVIDGFQGTPRELHTILDILKRVPVVYTTINPMRLDPSVADLRLTGLRPDAARELFERSFGASVADDPDTMDFVNVVLEGNPLLIGHAATLARTGALLALQGPESLAVLTFNHMTIGEQQLFASIAAFGEARPSRATTEIVSGVARASAVMNALLSRLILQTDGERLWISPLMRPLLSAASSLIRYDAMFSHADDVLSSAEIPRSVVENAQPFLAILHLAETKGRYAQIARNARSLADALLLGGRIDEAREACELVRSAANETHDSALQAWAQHQLGTLSALCGDVAEGISWLESSEMLRERNGDIIGKLQSQKNAVLLRKAPISKKSTVPKGIVWDVTLISWTIALIAFIAISRAFGWSSVRMSAMSHARVQAHAHLHTHLRARILGSTVLPKKRVADLPHNDGVPTTAVVWERQTPLPLPLFVSLPVTVVSESHVGEVHAAHPGSIAHHVGKHVTADPFIAQFTASSYRVFAGSSASLCFRLSNATSAFLEPVGKINAHSGCVSDAPRTSTYYTLYAYNQNGMASASLRVKVLPADAQESTPQEARMP